MTRPLFVFVPIRPLDFEAFCRAFLGMQTPMDEPPKTATDYRSPMKRDGTIAPVWFG